MLLLLERASLQVLTSVDRKVHIINYMVYSPVPRSGSGHKGVNQPWVLRSSFVVANDEEYGQVSS